MLITNKVNWFHYLPLPVSPSSWVRVDMMRQALISPPTWPTHRGAARWPEPFPSDHRSTAHCLIPPRCLGCSQHWGPCLEPGEKKKKKIDSEYSSVPQWFELLMPYSIRSCWGLQIKLVKGKVVFLLLIEHILAPYGSEACRRENIHFIVFFPYKTV